MNASIPHEGLPAKPADSSQTISLHTSNILNVPAPAGAEATVPHPESDGKRLAQKLALRKAYKKGRMKEQRAKAAQVKRKVVVRTPFAHRQQIYDSYTTLLRELKQHPPLLPPSQHLTTRLRAIPTFYETPQKIPLSEQAPLSSYRFVMPNSCIYRRQLGQVLYIMRREWFEAGYLFQTFSPLTNYRCELFWKNPATGHCHYLGVFQLVKSWLFSYNHAECAGIPERNETQIVPKRGLKDGPYGFLVLQYLEWNPAVYDALFPTPV